MSERSDSGKTASTGADEVTKDTKGSSYMDATCANSTFAGSFLIASKLSGVEVNDRKASRRLFSTVKNDQPLGEYRQASFPQRQQVACDIGPLEAYLQLTIKGNIYNYLQQILISESYEMTL